MDLLIKKLYSDAKLPEKAYDNDAGFDLFYLTKAISANLEPNERRLISTGIACKLPKGYCGILKDRSGNATKKGLHVLAGIIDEAYTGQIKVCIVNLSDKKVTINAGDKIAQMLIVPVPKAVIKEVDELEETDRGDSGFGSTGN